MIVAVVPLAAVDPVTFTSTPVVDVWLLVTLPPLICPLETVEVTMLLSEEKMIELWATTTPPTESVTVTQ